MYLCVYLSTCLSFYLFICLFINLSIYKQDIHMYICIHRHVFRPSQDSSVWLGLTSREQLMSPECSKHQLLSFAKMLVVWWTKKKYSVLISVLQSAQCIIYIYTIYLCIDLYLNWWAQCAVSLVNHLRAVVDTLCHLRTHQCYRISERWISQK